jgi:hypothetical protein
MGRRASEAERPAEASMRSAYVRVVAVWLGVLVALWWLQQAFL